MSYDRNVMFSANTAVTESPWFEVGGLESFVVIISGMEIGDALELWGTNDDLSRTGLDQEVLLAEVTEDGVYQLTPDGIPVQVRLKRTNISGGGTIRATYSGRR